MAGLKGQGIKLLPQGKGSKNFQWHLMDLNTPVKKSTKIIPISEARNNTNIKCVDLKKMKKPKLLQIGNMIQWQFEKGRFLSGLESQISNRYLCPESNQPRMYGLLDICKCCNLDSYEQ